VPIYSQTIIFSILPTTASIATDQSSARGILTSGPLLVPNLHAGLKDAPAALLCYIGAERGAAIESFSVEEVGTALHEILASVVGGGRAVPSPTKCGMTRWLQDPLALGATTGPVRFQDGAEPADYEKTGEPAWSGSKSQRFARLLHEPGLPQNSSSPASTRSRTGAAAYLALCSLAFGRRNVCWPLLEIIVATYKLSGWDSIAVRRLCAEFP
jgi:hypothetical protein